MSRWICCAPCTASMPAAERPPEEDFGQSVPRRIVYSVRDKSLQILQRCGRERHAWSELYRDCRSRSEVVATFLSVLELCSMGSVRIERREAELCAPLHRRRCGGNPGKDCRIK